MTGSNPGVAGHRTSRIVVLAAVLAACGGSSGTATTGAGGATGTVGGDGAVKTTAPRPADSGTAPIAGEDGAPAPSDGTLNTGSVTIDDTTWEFDATPGALKRCDPDFFGAFWVIGESPDGDGVTILLPPPDDPNFEDPPSVRVGVNDGGPDFTADPSILDTGNYDTVISEGDSQVDSYTVDGNTASGTATFVDEQEIFAALGGAADDPEPVRGSFEVTCAGE